MKIASKSFLICFNLMGSLMIISSNSWFSIWMGMEMSSMSIPSLVMMFNSSLVSKINSWKYYVVQCFSSTIFFLCTISLSFSSPSYSFSNILWMMIFLSMMFKMGIFPFHGWLLHLSFSIPWTLFLILSTIQKIGPLIIISECSKALSQSIQLDLLISSIISLTAIMSLKTNSIRYLFIMSSIINSMWMIASTQASKSSFLFFMLFYFSHLVILFFSLSMEYSNSSESLFTMTKKNFTSEIAKMLVISSLIGIPPLMGFFMKMSILEQLLMSNQIMVSILLTMVSSIIMLLYLKMLISTINNMRIISMKQFKLDKLSSVSFFFLSIGLFYLII